jgi:tyrosinase
MATGSPSPQSPGVPLRYRQSVAELTDAQVAELRAAFADMQATSDDRGYEYWAGLHGLPLPMWCDKFGHGKPTFLHWHRAYLQQFELKLRAAGNGHDVRLPWWDWTAMPEVPPVYAAPQAAGAANSLYSSAIAPLALQQGQRADPETQQLAGEPTTVRDPGLPGTELPTAADIQTVLAYQDFDSFTRNLEDWHNQVHVWVGGHMGDIPFAAYDPVFWAHHAMIDRVWRLWQLRYPGSASVPAALANQVMEPFGVTAGGTLDVTALGYDYATSATDVKAA